MKKFFKHIWYIPRYIAMGCIIVYQKLISPDHSFWAKTFYPHGYCQFHPTCSRYGYEAIKKYGLIRGLPKTAWRIFRCNPWSKGGVDLP